VGEENKWSEGELLEACVLAMVVIMRGIALLHLPHPFECYQQPVRNAR
jgi:hypothetical protein